MSNVSNKKLRQHKELNGKCFMSSSFFINYFMQNICQYVRMCMCVSVSECVCEYVWCEGYKIEI